MNPIDLIPDKAVLTPGDVAIVFGVDPKTVTRWATQGAIPSFRTPRGQHRFLTSDVVALVLQQTQES